jgi:hypothetical protein
LLLFLATFAVNIRDVNGLYNDIIIATQRQIYEQSGQRTDVYVQEGQGALFVPEGYPLIPQNVILALPEEHLRIFSWR